MLLYSIDSMVYLTETVEVISPVMGDVFVDVYRKTNFFSSYKSQKKLTQLLPFLWHSVTYYMDYKILLFVFLDGEHIKFYERSFVLLSKHFHCFVCFFVDSKQGFFGIVYFVLLQAILLHAPNNLSPVRNAEFQHHRSYFFNVIIAAWSEI